MKIPKKVAKVMYTVGYFSMWGTLAIPVYSTFKKDQLQHSAYHVRLEEIRKTSSDLVPKLAECIPATKLLPSQECIDLKVQYNDLEQEQKAILNSENYKAIEKQIQNLPGLGYSVGFLFPVASISYVGLIALRRRRYEEQDISESKGRVCNQQL